MRILRLVAVGVFFSLGTTAVFSIWVDVLVWKIVLGLVFGALASLWASRQIAGPFYRLEKDLESILHGANRGQKIHLRDGDPLEHLADLVNKLLERTQSN